MHSAKLSLCFLRLVPYFFAQFLDNANPAFIRNENKCYTIYVQCCFCFCYFFSLTLFRMANSFPFFIIYFVSCMWSVIRIHFFLVFNSSPQNGILRDSTYVLSLVCFVFIFLSWKIAPNKISRKWLQRIDFEAAAQEEKRDCILKRVAEVEGTRVSTFE